MLEFSVGSLETKEEVNFSLEKDSFVEFLKKIIEAKKELLGDVNSNKSLIVFISLNKSPFIIFEDLAFKPVYHMGEVVEMLEKS